MATGPSTPSWPPSRRELQLYAGAFALLLVAWYPRLLPGNLSADDYKLLTSPPAEAYRVYLAQGRFLQPVLLEAMQRLGAGPVFAPTLVNLVAMALLAGCVALLARLWGLEDDPAVALAAAGLAFTHPFGADLWSFRITPISFAVALSSGLLALALLRRTSGGFLLPLGLLAGGVAVYQAAVNPLLVVLAVGALLDLARVPASGAGRKAVIQVWGVMLACVVAALLIHLGLAQLVRSVAGVPAEARASLASPGELWARLPAIAEQLQRVLYRERVLGTGLQAALQLALLVLALGLCAAQAASERAPSRLGQTVLLLGLALLATVGVVGLAKVFWPSPRTLIGAGFFWAGVLAFASTLAGRRPRAAALAIACALSFGWAGVDHRAQADQARLGIRDQLRMSRVLGRLEGLPGFAGLRRLAVVNAATGYGDLKTTTGDLNVSALAQAWSPAGLATEAGGPWLQQATSDEQARAAARCAAAPKYPAEGSLLIDGELGIVCF